jgi:hypothetical protein
VLDQYPESKWRVRKAGAFLALRVHMITEAQRRKFALEKPAEQAERAPATNSFTNGSRERRGSTPSSLSFLSIGGAVRGGRRATMRRASVSASSVLDGAQLTLRLESMESAMSVSFDLMNERFDALMSAVEESRTEARRVSRSVRSQVRDEVQRVLSGGGSSGGGGGDSGRDNSRDSGHEKGRARSPDRVRRHEPESRSVSFPRNLSSRLAGSPDGTGNGGKEGTEQKQPSPQSASNGSARASRVASFNRRSREERAAAAPPSPSQLLDLCTVPRSRGAADEGKKLRQALASRREAAVEAAVRRRAANANLADAALSPTRHTIEQTLTESVDSCRSVGCRLRPTVLRVMRRLRMI